MDADADQPILERAFPGGFDGRQHVGGGIGGAIADEVEVLETVLGRVDIDMRLEPDIGPARGGGETLGLDGQLRIFLIVDDKGVHLDDFAYQFAHHSAPRGKGEGRTAPCRFLRGACDRLVGVTPLPSRRAYR